MPAEGTGEVYYEEPASVRKKKEADIGLLLTLNQSTENNTPVLINCRDKKKFLAHVKGFDRYANMVLVDVKEMWTEILQTEDGKKAKPITKDRFISKMFLMGSCVTSVQENPLTYDHY